MAAKTSILTINFKSNIFVEVDPGDLSLSVQDSLIGIKKKRLNLLRYSFWHSLWPNTLDYNKKIK